MSSHDLPFYQKKKFLHEVKSYLWEDPLLRKMGLNQVIQKCILKTEVASIMKHNQSSEYIEHFDITKMAAMVL